MPAALEALTPPPRGVAVACIATVQIAELLLVGTSGWEPGKGRARARLADASDGVPAVGLAQKTIKAGAAFGPVTLARVTGVNTSGASVGAPVYLGENGAWTLTVPGAGLLRQIVGRVRTIHASAGMIEFNLDAAEAVPAPADALLEHQLRHKPHGDVRQAAWGLVRFTGSTADNDRITITGPSGPARVYEFDTASSPALLAGADVRVNINGGAGSSASAAAFAAAVNGDASRVVEAKVVNSTWVLLIQRDPTIDPVSITVANPTDANSSIQLHAFTGAVSAAARPTLEFRRTLTSDDITHMGSDLAVLLGIAGSAGTFELQNVTVWRTPSAGKRATVSTAGLEFAWVSFSSSGVTGLTVLDTNESAVLAAGDVVVVSATLAR